MIYAKAKCFVIDNSKKVPKGLEVGKEYWTIFNGFYGNYCTFDIVLIVSKKKVLKERYYRDTFTYDLATKEIIVEGHTFIITGWIKDDEVEIFPYEGLYYDKLSRELPHVLKPLNCLELVTEYPLPLKLAHKIDSFTIGNIKFTGKEQYRTITGMSRGTNKDLGLEIEQCFELNADEKAELLKLAIPQLQLSQEVIDKFDNKGQQQLMEDTPGQVLHFKLEERLVFNDSAYEQLNPNTTGIGSCCIMTAVIPGSVKVEPEAKSKWVRKHKDEIIKICLCQAAVYDLYLRVSWKDRISMKSLLELLRNIEAHYFIVKPGILIKGATKNLIEVHVASRLYQEK